MAIGHWWKLARGINVTMGATTVLVGALIVGGGNEAENAVPLALHAASVGTFIAGWNALNDVKDVEIDKVNHPDRPIPSGHISEANAIKFGNTMMLISAITLVTIIWHAHTTIGAAEWYDSLVIWMLALFLMVAYEYDGVPFNPCLKRQGFWGNIAISCLVAVVIVFGAASIGEGTNPLPWMVALSAILMSSAREIIKDIEDQEGDTDRITLPMKVGEGKARNYVWIMTLFAFITMVFPFAVELLPQGLLLVMLPSLLCLLAVKPTLIKGEDSKGSKLLKRAMIFGILGFTVCGIIANNMF